MFSAKLARAGKYRSLSGTQGADNRRSQCLTCFISGRDKYKNVTRWPAFLCERTFRSCWMPIRRKPRGPLTSQSMDHEGTHSPMSPEFNLPWTGERLVPSHTGDTAIEHLHRYAFAREYIEGKDVLDIACGEGYGSHMMSNIAANVVGVDISPEVIAHARNRYGDKVTFSVGSCTDIPLSSASFDVVVSFETLEHLAGHEQMLKEVKRVLRPGGVLILSSPDKLNYTILPKTQNPFHVRELSKEEFRSSGGQIFCSLLHVRTKDLPWICFGPDRRSGRNWSSPLHGRLPSIGIY